MVVLTERSGFVDDYLTTGLVTHQFMTSCSDEADIILLCVRWYLTYPPVI